MAGRFGAFAKLSRDDGGGRPTDTWSCARCSRRNSPALKRCENESCRAVRGDGRLDPARVPGRRHADMGFEPRAGTRSRSGAAAWAGPARAPPRDPAARVDPPAGPRARARRRGRRGAIEVREKRLFSTPILRNADATGETRVSGTRTNATSRRDTRERDVPSDVPSDDMSKDERFINRTSVYKPTSTPDSDPVLVETAVRPGSPTRASRRRMSSWTRTATPRTTFSSRIPIQISRARIFKPRRREMREKKTVAAGPLKRRLH